MPFNFTQIPAATIEGSLQSTIQQHLTESRARTLRLFEGIDAEIFRLQANPDFSPVGWHLGHIGFTEGLWLLEQSAGYAPLFPDYRRLFAADGLPKSDRQNLPKIDEIHTYISQIRTKVDRYLQIAPLKSQAWLWYWLIQHESQHCETITWILQLHHQQTQPLSAVPITSMASPWPLPCPAEYTPLPQAAPPLQDMVFIEGGEFLCGNDSIEALDNEQQAHWASVDPFWIDRFPITQADYRQFMEVGGYRQRQFWSAEGWQWLQTHPVNHPSHWIATDGDNHPVCGVSWYEADAYARFVGKRLPTEAEWEKAASLSTRNPQHNVAGHKSIYPWGNQPPTLDYCNYGAAHWGTTPVDSHPLGQSTSGCHDMIGNVWEWTDTWFHPYSDFQPYPYRGYSQAYFDHLHRVLKGGSWATQAPVLRNTFRNWYEPRIRIHFAGFRCAYS